MTSSSRPLDRNYVYKNDGNFDVINLIDKKSICILDVGCGAGDNARIIKGLNPSYKIDGITFSTAEASLAKLFLDECWVFNLEDEFPHDLLLKSYDCIIFSHILEHLKSPEVILNKITPLLNSGGEVIIAVPNILSWRMRLQFLLGNFSYVQAGELDSTHLRFFTFFTADSYLLQNSDNLKVAFKTVTGSFPLWFLRRILPSFLVNYIDRFSCKLFPNLFGSQILIKVVKYE